MGDAAVPLHEGDLKQYQKCTRSFSKHSPGRSCALKITIPSLAVSGFALCHKPRVLLGLAGLVAPDKKMHVGAECCLERPS